MMHVLFDAHHLGRRQTGNETYVRELLARLRNVDGLSLVAAVEPGEADEGILAPPVQVRRVPPNGVGRLAALAYLARRLRPDIVHAVYFLPPFTGRPTVLTVHDISFERYPEFFSRGALLRDRSLVRLSALRASRVITVSETSRRDLITLYGLAEDRVIAIPNGVSPRFRPRPGDHHDDPPSTRPLRLLAVGTLQPRKNLVRLIEAVRRVSRDLPVSLRVVGPDGFQGAEIRRRLDRFTDVQIVGYVTEEQLADEYRSADALVYPSIYEGFGLPVLEAMACGTPVVTSSGGSLPEVAGDAAEIVDPFDVDALTAAILRVAHPAHAAELRRRGLARAAEFSWDRTARQHLRVYEQLAKEWGS